MQRLRREKKREKDKNLVLLIFTEKFSDFILVFTKNRTNFYKKVDNPI